MLRDTPVTLKRWRRCTIGRRVAELFFVSLSAALVQAFPALAIRAMGGLAGLEWDNVALGVVADLVGMATGIVVVHRWLGLPWRPLLVFLVPTGIISVIARPLYGSGNPPVLPGVIMVVVFLGALGLAALLEPRSAQPTTDSPEPASTS